MLLVVMLCLAHKIPDRLELIVIDGVFLDSDTLKTNLSLQCRDAGIKFTCL